MSDGFGRRDFLKVLGAGSAGAAASGCSTETVERLIPYVTPPEEITPGVATWYATTCGECSAGCGIRVRTREGRAVMIEGNPDHPVSKGGLCARGVSALQGLYDPDRITSPMRAANGGFEPISWDEALDLLADRLGTGGRSLFLTGPKGPTEGLFLNQFADALGGRRVVYDPLDDSALREAARIAFGVNALPRYDFREADFLVSFGADFLETWRSPAQFSADFAAMHGVADGRKGRFVFVGSRLSLTGQNADEWIPARPGSEAQVALAVAGEVLRRRIEAGELAPGSAEVGPYEAMLSNTDLASAAEAAGAGVTAEDLAALAEGLAAGNGLALGPGLAGHHPGATAANLAVLVLNAVAGAVGRAMHVDAVPDGEASSHSAMAESLAEMAEGAYGVAVVSGANPAYSLPPAAGFAQAFANVPFKVAFATAPDETTALADLVLPDAHPLESWSDAIPAPGAYSVRQPVMRPVPLFDSRPMSDVLLETGSRLGHDFGAANFHDYLRAANRAWLEANAEAVGLVGDPDARWRDALRTGFVSYADTSAKVDALQPPETAVAFDAPAFEGEGDLTLLVYPSSRFGAGAHADRPWLQELPDPVSKIMWHSWAELNPVTATRLGVKSGDVVRIATAQGEVEVPVWVYPGVLEDVVAVAMGGGHTVFGQFARGFAQGPGVNPMTLLPAAVDAESGAPAMVSTRVSVTPTGEWRRLASTEGSHDQDDRNVAPAIALASLGNGNGGAAESSDAGSDDHATDDPAADHAAQDDAHGGHGQLRELQEGGGFIPVPTEGRAEDFPLPGSDFGEYGDHHPRWAMAIDLDKCTGCGACVTACQAENNVPWVGETEALNGREMHWLRIERYYETVDPSHAGPVDVRFLPMLCQHCNNAPCEPVCPVFAAYHTPDGLNAQAYNRCVGTRYCANNCPYKVRVFNWYSYTSQERIPEPLNWQFNPDVTVRDNGVMEKCTFCVQRIRDAGGRAAVEGRDVRDGEVYTACQSVCGADAIVFGNIRDHDSRVASAAHDERTYRVLDELINTQPAVHYMKKVVHHDVDEGGH